MHYSASNLDRLGYIRKEKMSVMAASIKHRCRRIVGKPPRGADVITLLDIAEILYEPEAPYHKRNKGMSKWIETVLQLARFSNDNLMGELAAAGFMVHWCWNEELQDACCEDDVTCNASHGRLGNDFHNQRLDL